MDQTTAAPNYPQNLNEMMSQGNPFLADMALEQQRQSQAQAQQNLAATQQATQQAAQMHPLAMQETQARTGLLGSQSAEAAANAAKMQDALKILKMVPDDIRAKTLLKENLSSASDSDKKIFTNKMTTLLPYATAAGANGGTLPLPLMARLQQSNPELIPYFKDAGTGLKTAQLAKAYVTSLPDYVKDTATANIRAGAEIETGRQRNAALERMNDASIAAGKYQNHTLDYAMQKNMGNYQGQAGVWTQKAQSEMDAAGQSSDPDQQAFHKQRAQVYADLAEQAKHAGVSQAAAAAYTSLASKVDPMGFGMQTVNPAHTPTPGGQPAAPANPKPQSAAKTYSSVADLEKDNPPDGTRVTVNGQTGTWKHK